MKKFNIFTLMFMVLLPFLAGCSKDEIIFDSELPRFELRAGYQLLEVIVPQGTSATDKIYIIGDFNGGMEAVGNPMWELQKAPDTDVKWGIYLDPTKFVDGKTLANGYTFYSVEQGEERSLDNEPVTHTEAPAVGARLNVVVYRWADFFNAPSKPGDVVHDGYTIYVVNSAGYSDMALYAWGDAEAFGGWPGMKPTGTETINGVTYTYFDTGAANEGLNLNLIFNNNGGTEQLDDYNVTLNQDFYLELTPDGVVELQPSEGTEHDGYSLYVCNLSSWSEVALYAWGDAELFGGWPGMKPTGTETINGVPYLYFDLGAANCAAGLEEHLILNNNGGGKQFDDVVVFNLDRNVFVELTDKGVKEIDPDNYEPGEIEDKETTDHYIYVQNLTGWSSFFVYAWGDSEVFGGWPGATATRAVYMDDAVWLVYTVNVTGTEVENLIFNDGNGTQYDAQTLTMDKDYYIVAYPDRAELTTVAANAPRKYISLKSSKK